MARAGGAVSPGRAGGDAVEARPEEQEIVVDDLERLLDEARVASPAVRLPDYRDVIAAHGRDAVEPLATWIDDPPTNTPSTASRGSCTGAASSARSSRWRGRLAGC
jgi:hypothetical protein